MTDQVFDPREFRQALGAFLTGVTVVTTFDEAGAPRGFTANSFTSVSLDPPLVLVCVAKRAGSFPVFAESDGFAVNILSESQLDVARVFATPVDDRFSKVGWENGPAGHPVFAGTAAWLDCHRHNYVDAGDHLIMIGRVAGFSHATHLPLGYSRGNFVSAELERTAAARSKLATEIIAILESKESVMLVGRDDGPLGLPTAPHIGNSDDPASLTGLLEAAGLDADLGFVFSVVDNTAAGKLRIIYRGTVEFRDISDPRYRLFDLRNIPWERLDSQPTRIALRRYVQERLQYRFGVYVGGPETGQIAEITSAPKISTNDQINSSDYDV